ncbi:MAG: VCBS repeat-containing protein, partial [Acidobacteriota bacterium]
LSTHRGEAGFGPPQKAPLPVDERIRRLAAADLDADADQDLLLVTSTELIILRNWRQGNYAPQARLPLPRGEKPTQILPLDYDSDGHMDVVILLERGFDFWRGDGRASLAHDDAARGDTIFFNEMLRPAQLTAADLDLDGDQDLLVTGRATTLQGAGLIGLFNDGNGRFAARTDLLEEPWPAARGSLVLDLDGDRDPDILSWGEAGLLRSFRGHGAENQNWLALRLRAPPNKVPRDARGVRLQVVAGTTTQWLEPRRPNLILGLGRDQPSLIKATWPNGISEYLFEPEAEAEHTLELSMRVEGSCPFLYASDGEDLRFVTDILGLSPVGMLAAPGHYVAADPEEYLRLPDWVAPIEATEEGAGSTLELAITEELREALYLDQAELVAVDAPSDVAVYNGEQWLPQAVQGLALHLLTPLEPPASVLDDRGHEVLDVVRQRDERFLTNHRGDNRYQGAVQPHQLTLELPAHIAAAENPVLVLVGWLHWGNTSTNVARSQDPDGAPMFPRLEVPDGAGGWRRVPARMGLPAGKTKPVVVDLTDTLDPADPRLRVTTDFEVYWDLIAAANRLPDDATPHRIHRLAPQSADLRWRGFSRWYRNADNGPYLFDYLDHRSYPWRLDSAGREIVLSWQELEGHYTAFGPVTDLLQQADDRLAVVGSGEEIRLRFDVANLPPLPDGWRRTFFLHSEGWEKDGDPNVACSRTVEPLPYRGMRHDPCSGQLRELRPQVEDASRSRWVARERLDRRVVAHGEAGGV